MAKFLITMLTSNDLGFLIRLVAIARELADRGHDVSLFNPWPAPTKLIKDAGLKNLRMPSPRLPTPSFDLSRISAAWDAEEMYSIMYGDVNFARTEVAFYRKMILDFEPDALVDTGGMTACLAARTLGIPMVSVLQGNFHPASDGFMWWKGRRPANLPSALENLNRIAGEYGTRSLGRCVELLAGDLSLIVGTPETDPLPPAAQVTYTGPILWQRSSDQIPDWLSKLSRSSPVIWVYPGNPRYSGSNPTGMDSIVVIRAAIAAFGNAPVQVILTTGHQSLPSEFRTLPSNFVHAAYLPGMAMAERSDLMVHHGGHSSVMLGMQSGTPAVIIPTNTERESNARRVVSLGAGEIVLPEVGDNCEKKISVNEFSSKVQRVLNDAEYVAAAGRVASSMRLFGGVREAVDQIERVTPGRQDS
jgi:UDP:flavonoid glycosyltransferase YjiC (YdhE family)